MDNTFEIEKRNDHSIQLRLNDPKHGMIDLIFHHEREFLIFVAGQHKENAENLLAQLKIEE